MIRHDFEPLTAPAPTRRSILSTLDAGLPAPHAAGSASDRLIGTLVHRLIERFGVTAQPDEVEVDATVSAHIPAGELLDDVDVAEVSRRARAAYAAMCGRADIQALCAAGEWLHELPFVMQAEGGVLRGTIDCLVRHPSAPGARGRYTVLEFKTGRPRSQHQMQVDMYRRAAELMFPDAQVDALLVYG